MEEKIVFNDIKYTFRSPYLYTVNRCGNSKVELDFYIEKNSSYNFCTFHLITGGSGILIIDGKEYMLRKNNLFITKPKQAHIYATNDSDPLHMMWIEFNGNNCSELISSLISPNNHIVNIRDNAEIYEDFDNLIKFINNSNDEVNPIKVSVLLYALICDVLTVISCQLPETKNYPIWLENSLKYISSNFYKKLTVVEIADYVGYSPEHFSRYFSKFMGVSVARYIVLMKIEKSITLLKNYDISIKDIAEKLSFTDSTHYIKCFKNTLGITPNKYRKFF